MMHCDPDSKPRRLPPVLFVAALILLLSAPAVARAAREDTPKATREAIEEAERAGRQEKGEKAAPVRVVPPEVQALLTKGNRFYALGEYESARIQYLEALKRDPKSPEAHYGLGMTYMAVGEINAAILAWRHARGVDAVTAGLFDEFGRFRAARDAVQAQLRATRRTQAEILTRREEGTRAKYVKKGVSGLFDSSNRAILGRLEVDQGAGDEGDSEAEGTSVVTGRGGEALGGRGGAVSEEDLAQSKLPPSATDLPLSVLKVPDAAASAPVASPPPPMSSEEVKDPKARGMYFARIGNNEAASRAFQEELVKNPDDADVIDYLAAIHLASGDVDRAEQGYKRLAILRPKDSPPLTNLGGIYMTLGRYDEARAVLKQALARNPRDVRAVNNLAGVDFKSGRVDDAIQHLKHAVEIDPNDLHARNNLAGIYYRQERFALAIEELQKILAVQPDYGVAAANLEEAIKRKREFDDAKRLHKMRARQIVVATQAEAEALRAQIKNADDFVRLAREKSLDPSGSSGGDMGFFSHGELEDSIEQAVKRLAPGEISGAVRIPGGYALFQRVN